MGTITKLRMIIVHFLAPKDIKMCYREEFTPQRYLAHYYVWESAPAMFRHSPRGSKTEAGNISLVGELFSVTYFKIFWSEEICNYHPQFCYGTHTTHGRGLRFNRPYPRRLESLTICGCNYKGSALSSVNTFLSSRVLEYSVYSAFQNIQYFPCFRIFRVFRILEYPCVPPFRSSFPPFRSSFPPFHRIESPSV